MGDGRGYSPSEIDAERGWNAITILCVLVLIACLGCCGLLTVARHVNPPPDWETPPTPTISTTDEGIRV